MATFSGVTRQHILQAIAEYDDRGADVFRGVYGFEPSTSYPLLHEGRSYDSRAVLGVAHRYATGRLATADEFGDGMAAAAALLRRRGFEVDDPASAAPARPVRSPRAPRAPKAPAATATRRAAAPEREAAICPTCSMALPATGVCDYCG